MLQFSGNRSVRVEMYSKVRARLGVVNIWRALPAASARPTPFSTRWPPNCFSIPVSYTHLTLPTILLV